MEDEINKSRDPEYKPRVVGPHSFSFDDILQNIDPAPDEETERFVAAIYAHRRQAAETPSPE